MKKTLFLLSILSLILLSSCNKTKYGNVTFWQKTGSGFGYTAVDLNGVSSNITIEYDSNPACGTSGCAVFNQIATGTYSYAASDGTSTWSGTVNITEGCTVIELQ